MNRGPARRGSNRQLFKTLTKAFVWVVLVIFVLTSVGVVLALR
ncbi:MAG: hypothetical protein QOI11_3089 [Candidatus Eremiobacteraeota bacterium]|jgi:hypothetical protein|nr:hypothetical protein [Candidatus Eremiobacteraeota bacterium]